MKKARSADPDMLPEYDFSKGIRGKYAKRFAKGTNIVVLESDVAKVFHDSKQVNEALRAITRLLALGVGKKRKKPEKKAVGY